MWVIKCKGETFYVNHLESSVGFSTKETPDNPHTKGSLKFKHVDINIEGGEAIVEPHKKA